MPLVPAKCTQCGGDLQIDNTKEAAVCPYCGSAFIVEKAVQLYNQTYNINANTVNVYKQESGRDSVDTLYETGIKALNAGNIQLAERCFDDIKKFYPSDYRGPWGKMKCYSQGNVLYNKNYFEREYANACVLSNVEQKSIITNEYNQFIGKYKRELEKKCQADQAERDAKIREQTLHAAAVLKQRKNDLYGFMVSEVICCAPFICSLVFNLGTLAKILLGILFFVGVGGVIGILPEVLTNLKSAEYHYQRCESGEYQRELERNL